MDEHAYHPAEVEVRGVEPLTRQCDCRVFPTIPHPRYVDRTRIELAAAGLQVQLAPLEHACPEKLRPSRFALDPKHGPRAILAPGKLG